MLKVYIFDDLISEFAMTQNNLMINQDITLIRHCYLL